MWGAEDGERAGALLEEASATAEELGAATLLELAAAVRLAATPWLRKRRADVLQPVGLSRPR
jgi:hypothetical protein